MLGEVIKPARSSRSAMIATRIVCIDLSEVPFTLQTTIIHIHIFWYIKIKYLIVPFIEGQMRSTGRSWSFMITWSTAIVLLKFSTRISSPITVVAEKKVQWFFRKNIWKCFWWSSFRSCSYSSLPQFPALHTILRYLSLSMFQKPAFSL